VAKQRTATVIEPAIPTFTLASSDMRWL